MEKPGIIKINRSRGKFIIIILLCSFFYTHYNCNSKTKSMETRGSVKGILQDELGNPVRDAIVMIVDGPSEFNDMASVSNDEGEFNISNVVIPGRYVLQIQANNKQKRKEVNLSSTDTVIKITY
jgi:hypothetical protein